MTMVAGISLAMLAFIIAIPTSFAQQATEQTQMTTNETAVANVTGPQLRVVQAELINGTAEVISNTTGSLMEINATLAQNLTEFERGIIINNIDNSSAIAQGAGAVQEVVQNELRSVAVARDICIDIYVLDDWVVIIIYEC